MSKRDCPRCGDPDRLIFKVPDPKAVDSKIDPDGFAFEMQAVHLESKRRIVDNKVSPGFFADGQDGPNGKEKGSGAVVNELKLGVADDAAIRFHSEAAQTDHKRTVDKKAISIAIAVNDHPLFKVTLSGNLIQFVVLHARNLTRFGRASIVVPHCVRAPGTRANQGAPFEVML